MVNARQQIYAQIEYHGLPGITRPCLNAIIRLIQFGDKISEAKLLTFENCHCFLLTVNNDADSVAIKTGFSSGYGGEGPKGLSSALQLLERHGATINEFEVPEKILLGIDDSCLKIQELNKVDFSKPVRPNRWRDYIFLSETKPIYDHDWLRSEFPAIIPYAIIDNRLIEQVLCFENSPDNSLITGYRKLEDIIRDRTELKEESGSKLFSKAFSGANSILYWKGCDSAEQTGRASLFIGTYMAYRNPRAHKHRYSSPAEAVREFLLLNQLFILESMSIKRPEK